VASWDNEFSFTRPPAPTAEAGANSRNVSHSGRTKLFHIRPMHSVLAREVPDITTPCGCTGASHPELSGLALGSELDPESSDQDFLAGLVDHATVSHVRRWLGLAHAMNALPGRHLDLATAQTIRSHKNSFMPAMRTTTICGTVFQVTWLPLTNWYLAMHLLTQAKNNVSALELKRPPGVRYQTAWLIKRKLLQVMAGHGRSCVNEKSRANTMGA